MPARLRFVPTSGGGSDDWLVRSTAAGVVFADPWETLPPVTSSSTPPGVSGTWRFTDNPAKLDLDTTIKPPGRAGSIRMNFLNVQGSQQDTQLRAYFGADKAFTIGDELWFSFRQYSPREFLWQPLPASSGTTGHKFGIMSHWENSHTNNEIVPGDPNNENELTGYIDGVDYNAGDTAFSSPLNSIDFRRQNITDRGINRLVGNHPDTGSPFTSGDQWQVRARWGQTYGARSNPGSPEYRKGYGDPFTGALRVPPSEWVTFICCATLTAWSSVRYRMWMARFGAAPILVRNMIQAVHTDSDYSNFWPMNYVTNLVDGGRKITGRTNNIPGVRVDVCGLQTPVGDGVLSWNATTQRLAWAGQGESAGTAVGFSDANSILVRNVCAGGGSTNSYLVVEKIGTMPVSDQSDTITIADGRPDTATWYSEFIVSTQIINAPGGFIPS